MQDHMQLLYIHVCHMLGHMLITHMNIASKVRLQQQLLIQNFLKSEIQYSATMLNADVKR